MTIDERMDRLAGIVETLAGTVAAHDRDIEAHDRQIGALIDVAENHDRRITALLSSAEKQKEDLKKLEELVNATIREWQAYLRRIPPQ